ncbi:terminase small subunit [Hoeflea algicola]|uniref:terminase small subunit n=1 Tax=Hoeflea algicola TaxID=2983763 RepID=UPI003CE58968
MFVKEYLVDLNATQAAIRAGYSKRNADKIGPELLGKTRIAEAISKAKDERSGRVEVTADMVLERLWNIATADPNDIIQLRRICCRYCHGDDHSYQWRDPEEFASALMAAEAVEAKQLPDADGGFGFDATAGPHPDCPRCYGEGHIDPHALDTRKLSDRARMLYAGVKVTRDGFEIKMHDQLKALENVAKHLGMFVEKHEHTGAGGGPIQTETRTWREVLRQEGEE